MKKVFLELENEITLILKAQVNDHGQPSQPANPS
jgi:hypothetical protein